MSRRLAIAQVLGATLFFSFVGPVAKLIPLVASAISFWRGCFAALALLFVVAATNIRSLRVARPSHVLGLIVLGLLLSGNWYFYILAVQVSTVAVAVVCLFTYPLLTVLVEPFLFKEEHRKTDLFSGALVVLGVALIVDRADLTSSTAQGASFGLLSAVCLTARNLWSRIAVVSYPASTVTFYQFVVAGLTFGPFALSSPEWPTSTDFAWLLLMGAILTTASFWLFTAALRHLTSSFSSILVSLQPVCATLIALFMLGELPSRRTILGGGLVLAAVLLALGSRAVRQT